MLTHIWLETGLKEHLNKLSTLELIQAADEQWSISAHSNFQLNFR